MGGKDENPMAFYSQDTSRDKKHDGIGSVIGGHVEGGQVISLLAPGTAGYVKLVLYSTAKKGTGYRVMRLQF